MQKVAIAALVICGGAIALLFFRASQPEPAPASPAVETSVRDGGFAQEVPSPRVEPPPTAPAARAVAIPPPSEPPPELVETASSLQRRHHWGLAFALFRSREDDVDACRDRYSPPPIAELVARSRLIAAAFPGRRPLQEIDMHQIVRFDISSVKDGFWLDSAKVLETSLEFPAPDGSRRRTLVDDASLNRCVESVLAGARLASEGSVPGERFRVEVLAGEAVYDIR
jgi:hypothetical protein